MNTLLPFKIARQKAEVPVQDLAYMLAIDGSNLSKIELGNRPLNMETVLLYHMLFGLQLKDFYSEEQVKTIRRKILNRCKRLISNLEFLHTPKSRNRLKYVNEVVNKLNNFEL